jgi:hypothetical protein
MGTSGIMGGDNWKVSRENVYIRGMKLKVER